MTITERQDDDPKKFDISFLGQAPPDLDTSSPEEIAAWVRDSFPDELAAAILERLGVDAEEPNYDNEGTPPEASEEQ